MRNINRFIIGLVAMLFISSCGTGHLAEPPELIGGKEYFPLDLGRNWIYAVDSVHFNSFNSSDPTDSFYHWVKESVIEDLDFNQGRMNRKIERSISTDSGNTWHFERYLHCSLSETEAIKTDLGKSILKLVFPISLHTSWNANAYNAEEKTTSNYFALAEKFQLNDSLLRNVVGVTYRNAKNLIRIDTEEEHFALHLGMVRREKKDITYKDLEQTKADGYMVRYTLIDFSN